VLYLVALLFIAANLTIGITLSSIAQNQLQAMQLTFFYFLRRCCCPVSCSVPRHARLGAGDRPAAAVDLFHAPGARHPAQGQRLGRPVAQHLAADRFIVVVMNFCVDVLPQDPGLGMKRAISWFLARRSPPCAGDPVQPPQIPTPGIHADAAPAPQTRVRRRSSGRRSGRVRADIPRRSVALFRSPSLDALVRQALENSPTLAARRASCARPRKI